MPCALLPQHQAKAPAAAAAAPAPAGPDASQEDGQHAADGRGGAAAGPALPNSCHSNHTNGPTASHPPDAPAPAPLSAPAHPAQQHAALFAQDSSPWPCVPGQGSRPGDASNPSADCSATPSRTPTCSGGDGNADSEGSGDTAPDGPRADFSTADPAPDAPDASNGPHGYEPAPHGQRSQRAFGARDGACRDAATTTLGPRRVASTPATPVWDAEAGHDVSVTARSALEHGSPARTGPGRCEPSQTRHCISTSLTKPSADSQVSQLSPAAAAGAQYPPCQPPAVGCVHQAAGCQVCQLQPAAPPWAAWHAPGPAGAAATYHARSAGSPLRPCHAEHEPPASRRPEGWPAPAAATAAAPAAHGRGEPPGSADEREPQHHAFTVPRHTETTADDAAAAAGSRARNWPRNGQP